METSSSSSSSSLFLSKLIVDYPTRSSWLPRQSFWYFPFRKQYTDFHFLSSCKVNLTKNLWQCFLTRPLQSGRIDFTQVRYLQFSDSQMAGSPLLRFRTIVSKNSWNSPGSQYWIQYSDPGGFTNLRQVSLESKLSGKEKWKNNFPGLVLGTNPVKLLFHFSYSDNLLSKLTLQ
jgi:hypothetical protein